MCRIAIFLHSHRVDFFCERTSLPVSSHSHSHVMSLKLTTPVNPLCGARDYMARIAFSRMSFEDIKETPLGRDRNRRIVVFPRLSGEAKEGCLERWLYQADRDGCLRGYLRYLQWRWKSKSLKELRGAPLVEAHLVCLIDSLDWSSAGGQFKVALSRTMFFRPPLLESSSD